ncbi:hypothetical protein J2S00_003381 [Caldalkalibacillus uzonensis]|uniref:Thiamine phosphate synthase n=1 Tax=Caldalkalibacillus uzonensis TaxID=353224 RepID=A0ABU0CWN4_9BACI|nr:hypothetical protein [Caldalkalibacillus uzonensis]MDQ0340557.1 hypothetical protein [Caldalkalibacillus uzonensis]
MNKFQQMIQSKPMSLIVSLPDNDLELARAAIDAGADGIKFHINVNHRASGNHFQGLDHYHDVFVQVRKEFNGLMGIVLGDSLSKINREEFNRAVEWGFDYYSLYGFHLPASLVNAEGMARTFAIAHGYDPVILQGLSKFNLDALEISTVPKEEYGSRLHFEDVLLYSAIVQQVNIPTIVPSQRSLVPEDVRPLREAGVKAIMLGAVVTGDHVETLKKAVSDFRNEVDKLST